MTYEIHANKDGKPYLKKVDRYRNTYNEGRGLWVEIGRITEIGIEKIVRQNQSNGLLVLPDEFGAYRALVLTE